MIKLFMPLIISAFFYNATSVKEEKNQNQKQETFVQQQKPIIIIKGNGRFVRNVYTPMKVVLANRDSTKENQQIAAFISPNGMISGNAMTAEYFVKPLTGDSITIRLMKPAKNGFTLLDSTRFKIYEK